MAEESRLTSVERRTRAFYEWEIAGRGWQLYENPVALEPPFRAFRRPSPSDGRGVDDSRRPTWLSSFVEGLMGGTNGGDDDLEDAPDPPRPAPWPRDIEFVEYSLSIPADIRVLSAPIVGWLHTLVAAQAPVAVELIGGRRCVELCLAADRRDAPNVLGQLKAAIPTLKALAPQESLEARWTELAEHHFSAAEFGLASEFMVPLSAKNVVSEPLLPIIAALAQLEEGEFGIYQVLFEVARQPWAESVLRSVVTPKGEPFFADAPEITAFAKEKVSSPLFAIALRVAGIADEGERAQEIIRNVAGALSHFGSPDSNELIPLFPKDLRSLEEDILGRTPHRSGMLLSADELVSLIQLPGAGVQVPELWRGRHKTKKAPAETSGPACVLGQNEHDGESTEVRLGVGAKTKHVHVVGASGTGKSTLLIRMILEDIAAGHGVGVLDPHGDLVDEVARRIPEPRIADVVMFDPADTEAVVGWNMLGADSETEKDLLTSDLVGVFRRLSTSWGDQMTAVLANAIMVFLESRRGGTLMDLRRFLVEAPFRAEILDTVDDPHTKSFWLTEFPLIAGRKPQAPILTRLDTFLRSRLIRNVVTVSEPKLSFKEVTDSGLIFLGKLSGGAIGTENAALLGSLLVSKLHQVTLARSTQDAEARRPFFLYIDEFHEVATPSMASLFSGVRKYGLGLTVAHQDLHQLHSSAPEVERSLLANAYTRICFRLGEADARQIQKGLSFFGAEDLMGLSLGEAICRVGSRSGDFNLRTELLPLLDAGEGAGRARRVRECSTKRWAVSIERAAPEVEADQTGAADTTPAPTEDVTPGRPNHGVSGPKQPAQPKLDKAMLDYLESVTAEPFLQVRQRNSRLGLSAWKGQQIKRAAVNTGLIKEVTINPGGRGKRFKLVELTSEGRSLMEKFGVAPKGGLGRGGVAHQWWAETVASWIEEQGVRSRIEDESSGVRVDIVALPRREKIAIEIEMGLGHVVENIKKDLDAGFDSVVSLLEHSRSVGRVEEKLSKEMEESPRNALMGDLRDFVEILSPLLFPEPASLAAPSQDEEPRRRRQRLTASQRPRPVLSDPGALSTPLAADYVGLSPATLETMRVRGGGPVFVKLGRRVVYRREDLDEWLNRSRQRSTSDDGQAMG